MGLHMPADANNGGTHTLCEKEKQYSAPTRKLQGLELHYYKKPTSHAIFFQGSKLFLKRQGRQVFYSLH